MLRSDPHSSGSRDKREGEGSFVRGVIYEREESMSVRRSGVSVRLFEASGEE